MKYVIFMIRSFKIMSKAFSCYVLKKKRKILLVKTRKNLEDCFWWYIHRHNFCRYGPENSNLYMCAVTFVMGYWHRHNSQRSRIRSCEIAPSSCRTCEYAFIDRHLFTMRILPRRYSIRQIVSLCSYYQIWLK